MSAREAILNAIKNNKPAQQSLPVISSGEWTSYENPVQKFEEVLSTIGGIVRRLDDIEHLKQEIAKEKQQGLFVFDGISATASEGKINSKQASEWEPLDKAFLKASIGVAENGAVWISETSMGDRLIPFICQHLVVILETKNIVSTMHDAYEHVSVFENGFGVFIAGPSKTADIEQSLVIGAHGARSMTVMLIN